VIPLVQREVAQHFAWYNGTDTSENQRDFSPFIGKGSGKPCECKVFPKIISLLLFYNSVKFFSIFSPVCWLFSGWNWIPYTRSRPTMEA
jgi:hypothetical protein